MWFKPTIPMGSGDANASAAALPPSAIPLGGVGGAVTVGTTPGARATPGAWATNPSDPRWVLAMRTAEELEGELLPQQKREHLLNLGAALGLGPFDANLVIAIVHDQARRGWRAEQCAAAGAERLALVPLPKATPMAASGVRRALVSSLIVAAVLGVELLILYLLFF